MDAAGVARRYHDVMIRHRGGRLNIRECKFPADDFVTRSPSLRSKSHTFVSVFKCGELIERCNKTGRCCPKSCAAALHWKR